MNKTFVITSIVVIAIILGVAVLLNQGGEENGSPETNSEKRTANLSKEFSDRVQAIAVERVGQPIEGFNATIYLEALSGLEPRDFDGVATKEGIYHYQAGELSFTRTVEQPITSAEEMINSEGMETLLANISARLGVDVTDEQALDSIIQLISAQGTGRDDTSTPTMTHATLKTSKGNIVLEFYPDLAPKTVANFQKLAESDFYDGVIFHRIIKGFMIQGGDPTGTGRGGPGYTFADELDPSSAIAKRGYMRGTLAMANSGPNTNGSQFFIVHQDSPLPYQYTIFGKVTSGMDVVDAIATVETNANDKPLEDVVIEDVIVETE